MKAKEASSMQKTSEVLFKPILLNLLMNNRMIEEISLKMKTL